MDRTTKEHQSALLHAALTYAARGWHVFPCHTPRDGRCSCRDLACQAVGKHPRTRHGLKDATCDDATIHRWWRQWPMANIAIATGALSGMVVLDEDTYKGGEKSRMALEQSYGAMPNTPEQLTGGGGMHYLFAHPGTRVKNGVEALGIGLDIRGDGGYIIAPPSVHASGKVYAWEVSHDPDDTPLAPMPAWLATVCAMPAAPRGPRAAGEDILEGARNDTLFRLGSSMRGRGFAHAAILGALHAINHEQCRPPLPEATIETIAAQCASYPPGAARNGLPPSTASVPPASASPSRTPYGDVYNAELLIARHGQNLRYCPLWDAWLVWTGTHWAKDDTEQVMHLARETIRAAGQQAFAEEDTKRASHLAKTLNNAKLSAMLAQARSLPNVMILPTALDAHPWLLNCQNGTLDLRTGSLSPHTREHLLTRCLAVSYDAHAPAVAWHQFLWRIMGGEPPEAEDGLSMAQLEAKALAETRARRLVAFLQRAVGYALAGDMSEECLFLLHGTGRNGKSKFLTTLHALLGPYAKTADMQSFLMQERETVRNDLADLFGTRLVTAVEVQDGKRFAEGLIKQLTGQDPIKARFLFKEYFQFLPEFTIFLAFNHKPTIRETGPALWSRIRLIPFAVTIPPEEQDKHLSQKLCAELPGILTWAVAGCLEWQRLGSLDPPPEVLDATEAWHAESDTIAQFVEEKCLLSPTVRIKASLLYAAYVEWAKQGGMPAVSQTAFGRELSQKGYPASADRVKWRLGIALYDHEDTTN